MHASLTSRAALILCTDRHEFMHSLWCTGSFISPHARRQFCDGSDGFASELHFVMHESRSDSVGRAWHERTQLRNGESIRAFDNSGNLSAKHASFRSGVVFLKHALYFDSRGAVSADAKIANKII